MLVQCCNQVYVLLVGRLGFVILLSEMYIMSEFSFSSLMVELSEDHWLTNLFIQVFLDLLVVFVGVL